MTASANRRFGERRQSERRAVTPWGSLGEVFLGGIWRTSAEIIGYAVEAADGRLGRVADFCIEKESSVVTEIVVVTRRLLPMQKRVVVPLNAIERIDPRERKIYVRPTRDELRRWSRRRFPWGRC
jgi:sporulation protein YlmC with PRC-barrel domain